MHRKNVKLQIDGPFIVSLRNKNLLIFFYDFIIGNLGDFEN